MRYTLLAIIFVCLCLTGTAQDMIENPDNPEKSNPGRILKLEKVLTISDESGDFFFTYPRDIKVTDDGSIFFHDREQIIRLNERGEFIHNYYKKGQGPGEMNSVRGLAVSGNYLIVYNAMPNKLVWFKFDGELYQDKKIESVTGFLRMALHRDGMFYFFKSGIPNTEDRFEILETPQTLIAIDSEGILKSEIASFPIKVFAKGTGRGGSMVSLSTVHSASFIDRYLFISHTSEYLIKVFDIESQVVVRSFNRKYKRIKPPKNWNAGGIGTQDGKIHRPPRPEYLNDISRLYVFKELLWVLTSTKDEQKGQLIDAFSIEGEFIDSFYLKIDGSLISAQGDYLFVLKRDEDDLLSIVKYKVIG